MVKKGWLAFNQDKSFHLNSKKDFRCRCIGYILIRAIFCESSCLIKVILHFKAEYNNFLLLIVVFPLELTALSEYAVVIW